MRFLVIIFFVFISLNILKSEQIFNGKNLTNFYISPSLNASVIYPLERGHEMLHLKKKGDWIQVTDKQTGLVGWVLSVDFTSQKPEESIGKKNYNLIFEEFKERVLEMSKAIESAINVKTFKEVKHMGGAAAYVIAEDNWFNGKRFQQQAFQVYEIWKGINQSPSFLSFRDSNNEEKFIVLSGPHRPRILKSNK